MTKACQDYHQPRNERMTMYKKDKLTCISYNGGWDFLYWLSRALLWNPPYILEKTATERGPYAAILSWYWVPYLHIYELFMDSDSGRLEHVAATRRADGCPKGGEANALYKNLGEGPLVCAAPPILHVPQTGEEWRWTLGCERHALSNTNRNMGGVDPSDQLKRYYSAHRNRAHWFSTALLHLLERGTTNMYTSHLETSRAKLMQLVTHRRDGGDGLVWTRQVFPRAGGRIHIPVPIDTDSDNV